jgi:O-antigen ligase
VGLVLAYGIWISGSRASLLVLIILAAMFPFLERSIKAAGFIALLGIVGIAMLDRILDQNDGSNALSRLLGSGSGGSDHERLEGLAEAWAVFQQSPIIGNGFEFETFLAHNIYMQVLTCVGIIGFVAFMLILWAFAIPLFTAKPPYRLLAYPAVAYIVVGPITPNLGSRYVGVMLAISFLAATIGKMGPHDVEPEEPETPAPPKHAGAQLGGVRPRRV